MNFATHVASFASLLILGGCPGPRTPSVHAATPLTVAVGRDGASLRGVAGDGTLTFAAIARAPGSPEPAASTVVEARRGDGVAWSVVLAGDGGPIATTAGLLVATLSGTGPIGVAQPASGAANTSAASAANASAANTSAANTSAANASAANTSAANTSAANTSAANTSAARGVASAVHGEPGAVIVALDAATGAARWRTTLDASEWCIVAGITAAPDGVIVGGSFSGSLRIRDRVVSSGGRSDGFVAKLTATGEIAWLVRVGGPGPDAVQGVAVRGPRVAIAGTFAAGADLHGQDLPAFDDRSPYADAFVAVLDATGARVWAATFGGKLAETVAGVAIDEAGRVAVAANAREVVHVGGADLVAQGLADGLVAWWAQDGTASHAVLLGGPDFDGLRAITAVGERIIVGGFYSGAMRLGDRAIAAGGGDDAFLAALDARGAVVDRWEVGGVGREEVTALAAVPGGFIAGVAYTAAANVAGATLPAPKDPLGGAAIVVRPVR